MYVLLDVPLYRPQGILHVVELFARYHAEWVAREWRLNQAYVDGTMLLVNINSLC